MTGLPQIEHHRLLPRVVAVVGCDGSGKSTLTADLMAELREVGPTKRIYLGQSSGHIARRVNSLPIIGPQIRRYLVRKANQVNDDKPATQDGISTIGIFLLSLWRAYKFRRMLTLSRRGVFVVTDRYPQAEVEGFYFDGSGLGRINQKSWLARKLKASEERLYRWMASHVPAVVIRLNVDIDTAFARKPDHKYSTLVSKISVLPTLNFNGARILDLDSLDPYDQVMASAMKAANFVGGATRVLPKELSVSEPATSETLQAATVKRPAQC